LVGRRTGAPDTKGYRSFTSAIAIAATRQATRIVIEIFQLVGTP
jgi:hypothetical protein